MSRQYSKRQDTLVLTFYFISILVLEEIEVYIQDAFARLLVANKIGLRSTKLIASVSIHIVTIVTCLFRSNYDSVSTHWYAFDLICILCFINKTLIAKTSALLINEMIFDQTGSAYVLITRKRCIHTPRHEAQIIINLKTRKARGARGVKFFTGPTWELA